MAATAGTRISKSGLVFHYDMDNTQKSWKGAPSTNLLSNPTKEVKGTTSEFVQYANLAPIFDTYGLVPYSLSLELKSKIPGSILVYMQNGSSTKYSFVHQTVNATTKYQRFVFNNLTPAISNSADTAATLAFYGTYGTGRIPSIRNVQVELGSVATPFVVGARSSSNNIVDLTRKNTITATNLTYTSNKFTFDGTDDILTGPALHFPDAQTIMIWLKPTENDAARRNPYNQRYGGYGTWTHETNGTINYYYGDGAGDTTPYVGHNSGFTVLQNETAFVCTTRNTTQSVWYKNGVRYSSFGHPYGSLTAHTTNIQIGGGYAGRYLGDIYSVMLYDRALSDTEISDTFNATRSRYGI